MKLVPDWRDFWKWFSVWWAAIGGAAPAAWLAVPEDMRAAVPDTYLAIAGGVFFVILVVARLIDQGGE